MQQSLPRRQTKRQAPSILLDICEKRSTVDKRSLPALVPKFSGSLEKFQFFCFFGCDRLGFALPLKWTELVTNLVILRDQDEPTRVAQLDIDSGSHVPPSHDNRILSKTSIQKSLDLRLISASDDPSKFPVATQ